MNSKRVPIWVYLSVFVTAVLSLYSMYYRQKVEDRNKAVAFAAEIDTIQQLSASQGLTLQQGLVDLKAQGLNAVVVPEQYVGELISGGQLQVIDGKYLQGSADVIRRVQHGVGDRFPSMVNNGNFVASTDTSVTIQFPDLNLVRTVSIGLDPDQTKLAQDMGLEIIARCTNPTSANSDTVTRTIAWLKDLGVSVFLPEGAQVLGRRDALDSFENALKTYGIDYATPEFGKLGGDEEVVEKIPDHVIRLHSAQSEELDKLKIDEAIDRYAKAARERNQRILLIRPLSSAADKPLSDFANLIKLISTETVKEGGIIGTPHPFTEPGVPSWVFPLTGLSLVPIVIWTAAGFFKQRWVLILAGLIALAIAAFCIRPMGRSLDALLAAVTLPTAAFLILDRRNIRWIAWEYLVITLISLTGGLAIAGLLNSLPYYIHAKQFMGVKFAHFFPIVLIGAYFFHQFGLVRKSLKSPLEWGKALLAFVVLGALAFMIARTGNDNPAAVSDTEIKLRNLLDAILFVRPRTKEFLIGHPFLIVGIGMLISLKRGDPKFQNWKGWITLCLMLGAIGETSIVNTMCHIHTPLTISLARIGVGFIAGGILGLAAWVVLSKVSGRFRTAEG
ncbi:MAG TPA: DUF5693 family protein [Fimbriimonadaceae bacterium]|jgi:hypothetical protein